MLNLISEQQFQLAPPPKTIGTHNATFHFDEVTACVLLTSLPDFQDYQVLRTRNLDLLAQCQIVVDVGGVYDPQKLRFDHHHREFDTTWNSTRTTTKLSSAGLVWKHYGTQILTTVFNVTKDPKPLHEFLYKVIFESIDAGDNGVRACECTEFTFVGGMPGLAGSVGSCNPGWGASPEQEAEGFRKAFEMVRKELLPIIGTLVEHYPLACEEMRAGLRGMKVSGARVVELSKYHIYHNFVSEVESEEEFKECKAPLAVVWFEEGYWFCRVLNKSGTCRQNRALFDTQKGRNETETEAVTIVASADCELIRRTAVQIVAEDKKVLDKSISELLVACE